LNCTRHPHRLCLAAALLSLGLGGATGRTAAPSPGNVDDSRAAAGDHAAARPNILFCMADDWGWPHAGAYGDPVVRTPAFDRLAREGVLFEHAFVTAPSCTPCRNSILTGQWPWRLEEGANLCSTLDPGFPVFPLLLQDAGYTVGHWRKAWGPGDWKALGRTRHPAGKEYRSLGAFLKQRPKDRPFCFWLGASDPHRPYKWQSGVRSGIDITAIRLPPDLPDHETVRKDVADYYFEVQRFDRDVAKAVKLLEDEGLLENTIVVMTGDNGMPFPRHKCTLYDSGTRAPLAIRWGKNMAGGRRLTDFVSLADLAPTFLDAAGVDIPGQMTGRSMMDLLRSDKSGRVDPSRDHVLTGRERHVQAQEKPNPGGYPMRSIRTDEYLYIYNFAPDRWPSGCPDPDLSFNGLPLADCDDSPTRTFLVQHRDDPAYRRFYDLAFAKRPAEELYDLKQDPGQLVNVAGQPGVAAAQAELHRRLFAELKATGDPRVIGGGEKFDNYPYYGRPRNKDRESK
jgi:arylsulfatase A-like enzyme